MNHKNLLYSLDSVSNNEIIRDGINGWTCVCRHEKMQDNPEALLDDAIVDIDLLSEKIYSISTYDMDNIRRSTYQDYKKRFSIKTLNIDS